MELNNRGVFQELWWKVNNEMNYNIEQTPKQITGGWTETEVFLCVIFVLFFYNEQ